MSVVDSRDLAAEYLICPCSIFLVQDQYYAILSKKRIDKLDSVIVKYFRDVRHDIRIVLRAVQMYRYLCQPGLIYILVAREGLEYLSDIGHILSQEPKRIAEPEKFIVWIYLHKPVH